MTRYRRLPLTGLHNARDLGGFSSMGGGVTGFGRFIRAEMPYDLTEGDLDFLKTYGVTMSVDLRGDPEVRRFPSALSGLCWAEYHRSPIVSGHGGGANPKQEDSANFRDVDWGAVYVQMAERQKTWVADTLEIMAGCRGGALYHCTTGKDRTGLITMVLLGLCGVSDQDITADYAVSQIYLRPMYKKLGHTLPHGQERMDLDSAFFRTEAKNMETVLAHIHKTYGDILTYVRDCGAGEDAIGGIRGMLLT